VALKILVASVALATVVGLAAIVSTTVVAPMMGVTSTDDGGVPSLPVTG